MNDAEYLRRYAEEGSEDAFAELVRLRIGLVYSAALRQTGGDASSAQDVTQAVFTDLARKARLLCRHRALIGWLYTSTHYAAAKLARAERRRRAREQEAYLMHEDLASPTPHIPPERLRPLLDDAMHLLPETDQRALLLRFFDGCSMAELGQHLGLSEAAAKKRIERALEKLRTVLARRGLPSTVAAVGAALSQEVAAATAPSELAAIVSGGALVSASIGAPGLGLLSFLTAPKIASGLVVLVLVLGGGTLAYVIRASYAWPVAPVGASAVHGSEIVSVPPNIEVIERAKTEADRPETIDHVPQPGPEVIRPELDRLPTPAPANPASQPLRVEPPGRIKIDQPPLSLQPAAASWTSDVQILDSSQLDQQPVPIVQARPNYPFEMLQSHIAGSVVVDFIIDATGLVHNAVAASSSRREFEPAAIAAVSQWRFTPGRKSGRAVSTHMQAPINFTLNSND